VPGRPAPHERSVSLRGAGPRPGSPQTVETSS
jgi:hypothetical protein